MDFAQKKAIKIFRFAANRVPAYKKFLKKHAVVPSQIKSWEDFIKKVPIITKINYLTAYPYEELFPDKTFCPIISMSSGSSGKPFYWPRDFSLTAEGGKIHEAIFRDIFHIGKKRVLAIVCFSMGTWIAGTYTADSIKYLARNGYNITITTPGIEQEDILAILRDIAPSFDMIILAGYPPYLMDVLVEAKRRGINLGELDTRLFFAGESFSEKWRSIIQGLAKIDSPLKGSVNIYGSADAAILGHENPTTIFMRRKAESNKKFAKELWGDTSYTPSLVSYYPEAKYFETSGDQLIFTADTGIPLVRYAIGDQGKILTAKKIQEKITKYGYRKEYNKMVGNKFIGPIIALLSREDVAVTFYALNIYPENIKAGLENKILRKYLTGSFVASVKLSKNGKRQHFFIDLELAKGVKSISKLKQNAGEKIFVAIKKANIEFRKLASSIGTKRSIPKIILHPNGHSKFQVKRSKHKWVLR